MLPKDIRIAVASDLVVLHDLREQHEGLKSNEEFELLYRYAKNRLNTIFSLAKRVDYDDDILRRAILDYLKIYLEFNYWFDVLDYDGGESHVACLLN